ncbi:Inner membrane ABC transporter permease protein ycjP [uncultured Clostridium sp.]|nr:Inner membrane ABC transporter permease protein ycjP [uncultured Clostridium sp.]
MTKRKNKIKEGNPFATVLMYAVCVLIGFITLYPMYYVLILSVSAPEFASTMKVYWFPKGFDLSAYKVLIQDTKMWRAYANTVLYVVSTTILMILTSAVVAYGLNYKKLIGRKYLNMFLLIPMYFSGGTIPSFLLITKLGLYDSPLSQIFPACFSIWNIILVKAYFRSIPDSLSEAAKIDGAGLIQVFTKIMIPLGKPIFAVVAVYTIVGVWNSWFNAMLYLPHTEWQPLQMYLRRVLIESTQSLKQVMDAATAREFAMKQLSNAQLKYAMIIFTSLPVLCTYPFFQKYFVKGMVLGSLKE